LNLSSVVFVGLVFSLAVTQIFWGLFFWPFSYLTLGACGLIIFYEFWDVVRIYIRGELTGKRLLVNFVAGIALLTGILLTAQWKLVV
ncbi:MAG: hypothetical protein R6V40_03080, partial [Candidatus Moraniibacteriota bacterium]